MAEINHLKPRKHIRVVEPPRELRKWYPGRWWRLEGRDSDCEKCHGEGEYTVNAYGQEIGTYDCKCNHVKAESSSESEIKGFWEPGDTVYRIYEKVDKEFREEPYDG